MGNSIDTLLLEEIGIIIIAVIIISFTLLALFINLYLPFKGERDYIKMEMKRSFSEKEYLHWKRKLKKLYLRSIPFIGRFFR